MPIGNLNEFKPESEDWSTYKTRLASWFTVNDIIDDGKQKAALIAMLGNEGVQLLVNLATPDRLEDKSYDELIQFLDNHFGARNEVAEAYVFDTRTQLSSESVSEFILALKKLSTHCNFGPTPQLKQKLRNRLVAGVRSDSIRQALIKEGATLTWDNAVTLATQMDNYQSSAMAQQASDVEVKAVYQQNRAPETNRSTNSATHMSSKVSKIKYNHDRSRCWRCGKSNHTPNNCRFKDASCHHCGQFGHIKPMCRRRQGQTNAVYEQSDQEQPYVDTHFANVLTIEKYSKTSNPYKINLLVNNSNLSMEIDTGASVSLIPYSLYLKHFSYLKLYKSNVNFRSFTGGVVKSSGKILVTVKHFDQTKRLWLHVLKASQFSLLGRDWLHELHLDWQAIKSVSTASVSDLSVRGLLSKYSGIFHGQGLLKGPPVKLELIDGAVPKRSKPYRVPIALQSLADKELDRLVNEGILKPVEHSEWSTSLMFVPKSDGSVRPCGDFKSTVNPLLKEVAPPQINMEDILSDLAGSKYFSNLDFTQATSI